MRTRPPRRDRLCESYSLVALQGGLATPKSTSARKSSRNEFYTTRSSPALSYVQNIVFRFATCVERAPATSMMRVDSLATALPLLAFQRNLYQLAEPF